MNDNPSSEDTKALTCRLNEEASRPYEDDFDNYMKKVDLVGKEYRLVHFNRYFKFAEFR